MCEICSKLTIKSDIVLVSLLLTLNRFHALFWCFYCWLWTSKFRLGNVWGLLFENHLCENLNLFHWKRSRFDIDILENDFLNRVIFLIRLIARNTHPCRYLELSSWFERIILDLCVKSNVILNFLLNFIYSRWFLAPSTLIQEWINICNYLPILATMKIFDVEFVNGIFKIKMLPPISTKTYTL